VSGISFQLRSTHFTKTSTPPHPAEFSSALNGKERATLIKMCNENVVDVVVCSDGMR